MAEVTERKAAAVSTIWRPYQIYVLALLTLITVLNYLDRGVLAVLQEPIKHDLKLSDWQLGLLSGPAFAIFYSVAGIPAARFAERLNRSSLLAVALGAWSAMTALCGAAAGFVQLAFCRLGVGMGEGGCIPISYSLLADLFSAKQRGFVMSVVSAGNPISAIITPLVVALVAHVFGWRAAFLAVGLPGVVVAVLVRLTLKEPRNAPDSVIKTPERASLLTDLRYLFGNRAFLYMFVGAAFTGMGVSGVSAFRVSYLVRSEGLDLTHAGAILSAAGAVGLLGSYVGGLIADRFADARGRSYVIVPAVSGVLTSIGYFVAFNQSNLTIVVVALIAGTFAYNLKDGPLYAAVQNIALSRMRATGAAVYMLAATVIGGSSGPMLAGGVSDHVAALQYHGLASYALACPGGRAAPGAALSAVSACASASSGGLRVALIVVSFAFGVASIFMMMASRTIRIGEPE